VKNESRGPMYGDLHFWLAKEHKLSQGQAQRILDSLFAKIRETVWEHGRYNVAPLGVFRVRAHSPRVVTAPGVEKPSNVPAYDVVTFRAATKWRRKVRETRNER
jgi:nucleoid DNA-binding protein